MLKTVLQIVLTRFLPAFAGALGAVVVASYPSLHAAFCVLR